MLKTLLLTYINKVCMYAYCVVVKCIAESQADIECVTVNRTQLRLLVIQLKRLLILIDPKITAYM